MCEEPDYYYAVLKSTTHRARKAHQCEACPDGIRPGDRYVSSFGISDSGDGAEIYKHCLRCWAMLDAIRAARPRDAIRWDLACGEDWLDSIGVLPPEVAALAFMTADEAQAQLAGQVAP